MCVVCVVCVCVCVCTGFCGLRDTNLYNNMGYDRGYYNLKVVYEDTAYVPVIQKASKKHTKCVFFENLKMHTVSCEG